MKERRPPGYWLPRELDDNLVDQLTSPHLVKRAMSDGRSVHEWEYSCDPHLFDCEKEGEVLGYILTVDLLQQLRVKQNEKRGEARE